MKVLDPEDLSPHLAQLRRLARELEALTGGDLFEVTVHAEDGIVLRAFVEGRVWDGVISWRVLYDQPAAAVDRALAAVRGAIERSKASDEALREKSGE